MTGQAIYIHWPFCVSKCPYCDFNSHVRDSIDEDRWRDALRREIVGWRERFSGEVTSIFFGGGTPSLMTPSTVEAVLGEVDQSFGIAAGCEITLEANPSTVEAERFRGFRAAGVNRLSLGVQSFDDSALRFLGRAHDASTALSAIETARHTFDRFSFDLIYALPEQTEAEWRAQLDRALDIAHGHLSLYQLTIEPNTGFAGAVRRGAWAPMDDDRAADFFDLTQSLCEAAGLPAYETSNHAAPGQQSLHNLAYWRYGSWIGVGPGAHGRPVQPDGERFATSNHKKPERWLEAIEADGQATEDFQPLSAAERAEESILMGLRLAEGIDLDRIGRETGLAPDQIIDPEATSAFVEQGLIERSASHLKVLPAGRLLLNAIVSHVIADRPTA